MGLEATMKQQQDGSKPLSGVWGFVSDFVPGPPRQGKRANPHVFRGALKID